MLEILNINTRGLPVILLFLCGLSAAHAQFGGNWPEIPEISAPSFMVMETVTGTILAERAPDMVFPPASLAKLMTLHLSQEDVSSEKLKSLEQYEVPPEGTSRRSGPGSSVLGLSEGDRLSLLTLQRATAVASANDAARTLALLSGDSMEAFVERMNLTARRIGMNNTLYADPDGWSGRAETTAADQMMFARYYLLRHPEAPRVIHGSPVLVYQEDDRLRSFPEKSNTNPLVGSVDGVDGLKTGTIPLSTFHLLATAERNGVRFIVLVMGISAESFAAGAKQRAEEALQLLEWSFDNFTLKSFDTAVNVNVRVKHGEKSQTVLRPDGFPEPMVVRTADGPESVILIDAPEYLVAPLATGDPAGTIRWFVDGVQVRRENLSATENIRQRWKIRDLFD